MFSDTIASALQKCALARLSESKNSSRLSSSDPHFRSSECPCVTSPHDCCLPKISITAKSAGTGRARFTSAVPNSATIDPKLGSRRIAGHSFPCDRAATGMSRSCGVSDSAIVTVDRK